MATQLGRYEILSELAPDAAGRGWLARDAERNRVVTLRVLDVLAGVDVTDRRAAVAAMDSANSVLATLARPDCLVILERLEHDGCPAFVTGHSEGQPLSTFCRPEALLPIDEAVELAARAAEALAAAERAGLVHGNLRPSSWLRVSRHAIQLTDLAVAHALRASGVRQAVLDHGASYLPPEYLRGGACTGAGDQFSLAAVLFELLGGEPAFGGQEDSSVVYRIVHEPPRDPDRLPRPIPVALREPLLRALAKQPDQRYPSCLEFAAAMRGAVGGVREEERLSPSSALERQGAVCASPAARRPVGRWPWVVLAALLVAASTAAFRDRLGLGFGAPAEVWAEARVSVDPPEAKLALDGIPIEGEDKLVRFRPDGPVGTLTATLGCRSVERRLVPSDAASQISLALPPSRLDWRLDPGVAGARVAVDGRRAVAAPVDVELDLCQDHRIAVEATGYRPVTLDLAAGVSLPEARARLSALNLERIPAGRLALPQLAGVKLVWFVDGQRIRDAERELELQEGAHTVRFKNDYHWLDGTVEVDVVAGRTTRADLGGIELANLTVQAFPPNAKVFLRRAGGAWKFLDETPATRRIAAGSYEVKVELVSTGESQVREIELAPGDNAPVRVSFGSV